MSFFPQALVSADNTSFHPLFRLLDDFDAYSRGSPSSHPTHHTKHHTNQVVKVFTPKFDVKELTDSYELHGELPGLEQKDVEVEFTDAQTLTVKGRTERSHIIDNLSRGAIEGTTQAQDGEKKALRATVQDEGDEGHESTSTEVVKAQEQEKPANQAKFWVSERSVGEFSRSFSFPVRVDQDQVKASMKNGILSIEVPKARKLESRKINIS